MKTMTYTQSRAHYAETLDGVVADREEVIVTRAGHEPVVIVSLADYESLEETAYLLQNPANARRLLASIERLESGDGTARDLIECRLGRGRLGGLHLLAGAGPPDCAADQ